jgi:hypothetical protein
VDARLHQLQTEAERVKTETLLAVLRDFHRDKLTQRQRHAAVARLVSDYESNNTYQYVIAREETQLSWLQSALVELGAALPQSTLPLTAPEAPKSKKADVAAYREVLAADAKFLGAFVARWRERVPTVTHARHRTMLNVVLGESVEHQRLFDQAAAGFEDVIGRRTGGVARVGAVLPDRWQE